MNENQENNLQNSVGSPTPVEPVTTPVEPTPVDSAPVAPAPVETPTPVAPAPVETSTPVAPAPVETPQVNISVAPVVNNTAAPIENTVEANKPKMNPIIAILFVIAVIGGGFYALYTYTDIFKSKSKNDNNVTTTTTKIQPARAPEFKSFDELVNYMSAELGDNNYSLLDASNDFTELDFELANKCKTKGDKVSFNIGSNSIEYTCNIGEDDEAFDGTPWAADVKINNSYTVHYELNTECALYNYYTDGTYLIEMVADQCTVSMDELNITNMKTNDTLKTKYADYFVESSGQDGISLSVVNKNKMLYFIAPDDDSNTSTTCRVKYVDLSSSSLSVNSLSYTNSCSTDQFE